MDKTSILCSRNDCFPPQFLRRTAKEVDRFPYVSSQCRAVRQLGACSASNRRLCALAAPTRWKKISPRQKCSWISAADNLSPPPPVYGTQFGARKHCVAVTRYRAKHVFAETCVEIVTSREEKEMLFAVLLSLIAQATLSLAAKHEIICQQDVLTNDVPYFVDKRTICNFEVVPIFVYAVSILPNTDNTQFCLKGKQRFAPPPQPPAPVQLVPTTNRVHF